MRLRHASLFSGQGGFDYAAELLGWENVFHCEISPILRKVLGYYWPDSISYEDIKTTDFTIHRGAIDVLTGGFPCQPYSNAGKRLGKDDERHLWPEMLRAIQEIRPPWVVGENVRGIISWNGGLVFEEVQTDLEAQGYKILPCILPAAGVGAPHRRDRVWFIAYNHTHWRRQKHQLRTRRNLSEECTCETKATTNTNCHGCDRCNCENEKQPNKGRFNAQCNAISGASIGTIANTSSKQSQGSFIYRGTSKTRSVERESGQLSGSVCGVWENFPTQPAFCTGNDGFSPKLDSAALLNGRIPKGRFIAYSKWRRESIKAAGNAIVPQVFMQIGKAINAYENMLKNEHSK